MGRSRKQPRSRKTGKRGGNAIPPSEGEADLRLIVRNALSGGYAVVNNSFILYYENKGGRAHEALL